MYLLPITIKKFYEQLNKFYEKNIPTKPNCEKKKTWIQIQNEKKGR